ncbi:antibiotic biosynthesis monooxygenase [Streptomyces goshikiensis]|uniref:antibiotic biosynthesis monooxygenase n=1 Tax=Streptomyces goshikiensis TaxID=1942 RepID=UPI0036C743D3
MIALFSVTEERCAELFSDLNALTADHVEHAEGFISSDLYPGLDGRTVALVAQWASTAAADKAMESAEALEFRRRISPYASFERRYLSPDKDRYPRCEEQE